ncbi:MAG: PadR family transcriptional regulator [Negativibacillus massiliensis]|uniref:PadR family transcriptional regulator n=1 Tax=Negativibacillus massiliensis TaxID=1871035 RepID=UPI0023F9465A|nr:PadR family transcriptional regulator [Negativibacillus massiliensis]MDY4047717.1 PadR family transcriptional regulator [Negativibacillus massiliensis]
MNTQFKKGALELCVLSQLKNADKYGYELTETISQEMELATGTLYLILKRLKDEDYVDVYSVESEGRPARKYYHLTQKGLEYQQTLCKEWKDFTAAVDRLIW